MKLLLVLSLRVFFRHRKEGFQSTAHLVIGLGFLTPPTRPSGSSARLDGSVGTSSARTACSPAGLDELG